MELKKRYVLGIIAVWALLAVFTTPPVRAESANFYVCITNRTNDVINYTRRWCHRDGSNCEAYKEITLGPGEKETHKGTYGKARMDVTIHTGGPQGYYRPYSFDGTPEGCQTKSQRRDGRSSDLVIKRDNRGFLRIYGQ